LNGVVHTRSAWIDAHEVVVVSYRPELLPYGDLVAAAMEHGCASRAWTTTDAQLAIARELLGSSAQRLAGKPRDAKESDQLFYLSKSPCRYLPLTPLQARRVNGALFQRAEISPWLSPRQEQLRSKVESLLQKRPKALEGLERPAQMDGLADHASKLASRLEEH
jgi:hypothetical protein